MAIYQPSQSYQWTLRRVIWTMFLLASVALGFWLLCRFNQAVFILLIAIVMGTVIRPGVMWLHRRGLPRVVGVIFIYVLLLALLIGFGLLLFPLIIEQGVTIAAAIPNYYQNLRDWIVNFPNQWIGRLGEFLPITLFAQQSVQQTGAQILNSLGQVLGVAASAAQILFVITAILLLAFYWTLDGPRIINSLLPLLPLEQRQPISELISAMETKIGAYVAGEAILCLIIAMLSLAAYWLIGLPNLLALAFIAGIMEAVPFMGPLLGALAASLVALSISPAKLVWVIVASIVIQQLENNLLVPRVMRRAVGVNPFVSLLSIFAFGSLFGLAGVLMAIPLAAILQLLLDHFVFTPESIRPIVVAATGRDPASWLHNAVQTLAQDLRKQTRIQKAGTDRSIQQNEQVLDEIEAIATDLDEVLTQKFSARSDRQFSPTLAMQLTTSQVVWFGIAIMIVLLGLILLWQLRVVVMYMLLAIALAAAMRPLLKFWVRRGLAMRLALILLGLFVLGSLGFMLFLGGMFASREIQQLVQMLPVQMIPMQTVPFQTVPFQTTLVQSEWQLPLWLKGRSFEQALISWLPSPGDLFNAFTGDQGQLVLPTLLGFTQSIADVVSGIPVVVVLSLYWSLYQSHFERLWFSLLPVRQRKQARDLWWTLESGVGAYIRGITVQSILAGLLFALGYWLFGSPYPTLLALTGALTYLIPVIGPALVIGPLLLVGMMAGIQISLPTTLYTVLVLTALEGWVKPRLFNRRWNNPILTIVILIALADALGLVSIIIAPSLSVACQILWNHLVSHRQDSHLLNSHPLPMGMGGATVQISDFKARQAVVLAEITAMAEPPLPVVISSMEQLTYLIEQAKPILATDLSEPFHLPQSIIQ